MDGWVWSSDWDGCGAGHTEDRGRADGPCLTAAATGVTGDVMGGHHPASER